MSHDQDLDTEAAPETRYERFLRLYSQTERGKNLWAEWMEIQTPETQQMLETWAGNLAEESGVSSEEARTYMAIQKLVEDRGLKFVDQFLKQADGDHRTLTPMAAKAKKKK
jgi:hypothetical protein